MRPIKFRVWHKRNKRIYKVFELDFDADDGDPFYCGKCWGKNGRQVFFIPEEVVLMQYTGLLDKNGKEIYEGDIVEWESKETGSPYGVHNTSRMMVEFKDQKWTPWLSPAMEIIGNIYENQELLKDSHA